VRHARALRLRPRHARGGPRRHLPRLHDFLWLAEDGMKMQGYNGSQLWDTTFAVQAIAATGLAAEAAGCLRRAGAYIDATQVGGIE
jgi:cycloartenol synthase